MREELSQKCDWHPNPLDCPDRVIVYGTRSRKYGLIIHDGGHSFITIAFCPWCGKNLCKRKRATT